MEKFVASRALIRYELWVMSDFFLRISIFDSGSGYFKAWLLQKAQLLNKALNFQSQLSIITGT